MNLLLDSTVLIDVLRRRRDRLDIMSQAFRQGYRLATTTINVGEVYSFMVPAEERRAEELFETLEVYPLTAEIARRAGSIRYAWARRGRTLSMSDTIVATTALEYGLTLMTDNRKDFPMPELTFVDLP